MRSSHRAITLIQNVGQLSCWKKTRMVCTIGNYDGLHRGHQVLLSWVKRRAQKEKAVSCVMTFGGSRGERTNARKPRLTSLLHKIVLLRRSGIDACFLFTFTRRLQNMSAEDFINRVLLKHFPLAALRVGYNFRFGKGRKGTPELIQAAAREHGISCSIQERVSLPQGKVSSSRIRTLVAQGKLRRVEHLLGRKYSLLGTVIKGVGRGTRLGYPTANLDVDSEVLPPDGIYAVTVDVLDIERKKTKKGLRITEKLSERNLLGIVNLGYSPTFKDIHERRVEVHVLDYHASLQGKILEITFHAFMRKEIAFPSEAALVKQIEADISSLRRKVFC